MGSLPGDETGAEGGSVGAGHRQAPHTADLIVEAWGPTRRACLEEAVAGLSSAFARVPSAAATRRRDVHVAGDDQELLVAVLEEVIYVVDVWGEVPVAAHLPDGAGPAIDGWFDVVDLAAVQVVGPCPKGVARHRLSIGPTGAGWACRAVVDV